MQSFSFSCFQLDPLVQLWRLTIAVHLSGDWCRTWLGLWLHNVWYAAQTVHIQFKVGLVGRVIDLSIISLSTLCRWKILYWHNDCLQTMMVMNVDAAMLAVSFPQCKNKKWHPFCDHHWFWQECIQKWRHIEFWLMPAAAFGTSRKHCTVSYLLKRSDNCHIATVNNEKEFGQSKPWFLFLTAMWRTTSWICKTFHPAC